jgi:hypothetical protein
MRPERGKRESYLTGQHELQHVFDQIIRIDPNEYCSQLASMAFCRNNREFEREKYEIEGIGVIYRSFLIRRASSSPHKKMRFPHFREACKVSMRLKKLVRKALKDNPSTDVVRIERESVMYLLNLAYVRATGLTYEQIIEPFQK